MKGGKMDAFSKGSVNTRKNNKDKIYETGKNDRFPTDKLHSSTPNSVKVPFGYQNLSWSVILFDTSRNDLAIFSATTQHVAHQFDNIYRKEIKRKTAFPKATHNISRF